MTVSPARVLRLALLDRFTQDFNRNLQAACEEFGIPELNFTINFARDAIEPQNYYDFPEDFQRLIDHREPDFPVFEMWVDDWLDQHIEKPRDFSGTVRAQWRVFLSVDGFRKTGFFAQLREALDSALIVTLRAGLANSVVSRGDLSRSPAIDLEWLDQDENTVHWIQQVDYSATFEVQI